MIIEIGTEILPPEPRWQWDPKRPLTGTTKFYVRVAEELVKKGHQVRVLRDDATDLLHNGVMYMGREGVGHSSLALDCNLQRHSTGPNHCKRRFQWTSFFGRTDICVGEGYDHLFLVSDYVHSTLAHALKCPASSLELGCDMETVAEPNLAARPKQCCYTSSPDRGGNFLQSIWPDVEAATGYRLEMSPYGTDFSDDELRNLYDRSRFWLYPAIGTDSIISTLEAQARGCIPFYVPHMGLPETCRYGITTDLFKFKEDLIRNLNKFDDMLLAHVTAARAKALAKKPIPTWADVAEGILKHV